MKRLLPLLAGLSTMGALAAAPAAVDASAAGEMRPYVAEDFLLAYDSFLGVGDLAHALQVARHAVVGDPSSIEWRLRLARVAEWSGQAELAWEQRNYLYHHGRRDDETRAALLRLGTVASHPEVLLEIWLDQANRGALTPAQWEEVDHLFETVARPAEGARFFEAQYRRRHEPQLLAWAAEHAAHAGLDDDALRLYLERSEIEPFSAAAVLSATTFLIRRDRLHEAHRLLEKHSRRVPDTERNYWLTLGGVAWDLAENESAERAYRHYLTQPAAEQELWSRLIYLVQQKDPREAAELSLAAYQRQGSVDHLKVALALADGSQDMPLQDRVFTAINAGDLPQLEADARFLLQRANYRQRRQAYDDAWRDLQQAIRLAPEDRELASAALWFVIDLRQRGAVEELLERWQGRAREDAAFWLPFAAAYHALDRYPQALPWYRREIARQPDDTLLLLNYADLLERLQMSGMAARVQRHAWHQLRTRQSVEKTSVAQGSNVELLALVRLTLLDRPGDGAMRLAHRVANELRDLPSDRVPNDQAKDLVLAWAIGSGQFGNAKSWMWRHYLSRQEMPPAWGESQTALQLQDTETLKQLLATRPESIPVYNRYDSAYALDDWQQALDIAFDGMEKSPVGNDLHDRYRLHAPLHSHHLQFGWRKEQLGDYASSQPELGLYLNLSQRWAIGLSWSRLTQKTREAQLDDLMPGQDRLLGFDVYWRGPRGTTQASLFRRNELAPHLGWRLGQDWRWNARTSVDGALEYRADATDSLPLRVAGYQSGLRLGLNYTLSKRETLRLGLRWSDYATQFGDALGGGQFLDLDAIHRLRTEYPDWRLRAYASIARYRYGSGIGARSLAALGPDIRAAIAAGTQNPVRYFLPEESQTVGVCFGMGENLAGQNIRTVYTRAWRHYYELCSTRNNVAGRGYSIDFGLVGSITGEDHVSLDLGQSIGGTGNQGTNRYFQLRYRHYF